MLGMRSSLGGGGGADGMKLPVQLLQIVHVGDAK